MLKKLVVLASLAATAGCAGQLAQRQVDAADVIARTGEPVQMRCADWDLTARDWNCKGCYK